MPSNIFSERTPPSSSPFSVAHIWATPNGIKKEVWRRRESAEWGKKKKKKKNLKRFSVDVIYLCHDCNIAESFCNAFRGETHSGSSVPRPHIHLKPLPSIDCHNLCRRRRRRHRHSCAKIHVAILKIYLYIRHKIHSGFSPSLDSVTCKFANNR